MIGQRPAHPFVIVGLPMRHPALRALELLPRVRQSRTAIREAVRALPNRGGLTIAEACELVERAHRILWDAWRVTNINNRHDIASRHPVLWRKELRGVNLLCSPDTACHGLAVVEGLLTIDARLVSTTPDRIRLYSATWQVRGKNHHISTTSGYIARRGNVACHGASANEAYRRLRRKLAASSKGCHTIDPLQTLIYRYRQRLKHLTVTLQDAIDAGCCRSGILHWCVIVGINPNGPPVPAMQLIEGYRLAPKRGVITTLQYVLHKNDCY